MRKVIVIFVLNFMCLFTLQAQEAGSTIVVNVSEISSNKGKIIVGLYANSDDFLKHIIDGKRVEINNKSCSVSFKNIPEGTYAISLFHDENNDGKMDTNFMGIPTEDYGCSNDARDFMGPPEWEDAKFELKEKIMIHHIKL
ncbi:MAG: DUF2141 domain-containing protein [Flavobacteriaceae bacterium]|nr:DUF2141 domain-containing protein [Flavobacteriaceae bacterium]